MSHSDKVAQIVSKLTDEQIVYLYIVDEIWGSSEAIEFPYIEDIEETGGVFDDDNTLTVDYVDGEFDDDHVHEVVSKWKNLHDEYGEMVEYMPPLKVLDEVLSDTALIEDFQNVVVTVMHDTGSSEDIWKVRDKDSVEVCSILMEADTVDTVSYTHLTLPTKA